VIKPKELWTGKQIFSLILPPKVNVSGKHSTYDSKIESTMPHLTVQDTKVTIQNGVLISGILCKKTLGAKTGGVIHAVIMEHGPEEARQFYGNVQTVINNWLLIHGFSIGIGDAVADEATQERIEARKGEASTEVEKVTELARLNKITPKPGNTMRQTFESLVNNELNNTVNKTGEDAEKALSVHNNFKAMSTAGSKGSQINISQIIACVGQQNVEGKRVPFGFRYRTLPHFVKDDYGPDSKGFVFNSYFKGLTPQEFFFHAMGGREGKQAWLGACFEASCCRGC
jgi:DNA-directed RNA polymerase II subunit RPB1